MIKMVKNKSMKQNRLGNLPARSAGKRKKTMSKPVAHTEPAVVASVPKDLTPELKAIRARLVGMLDQTRQDIEHEVRGAGERDPAHIIEISDMATDALEGDLALRIAESETAEAGEIQRAIEKIDEGNYETCDVCEKPIGQERHEFLPYVTMCINCQELAEIRKRKEGDQVEDLSEGTEGEGEEPDADAAAELSKTRTGPSWQEN
jgi:DnaK suppressor protein